MTDHGRRRSPRSRSNAPARGMRMTDQRRIIAQIVEASPDHPDVEELHRRAVARDPAYLLSTVYRTLNLFEEAGLVTKHDFKDGRAALRDHSRQPSRPPDRHPLRPGRSSSATRRSRRCRKLIARRLGYRLVDHRLELYAVPIDGPAEGDQQAMIVRVAVLPFCPGALHRHRPAVPIRHHPARPAVLERVAARLPQARLRFSRPQGHHDRPARGDAADASRMQSHLLDRHHRHRFGRRPDLRRQVRHRPLAGGRLHGHDAKDHLCRPHAQHECLAAPPAKWRTGWPRAATCCCSPRVSPTSAPTSCRSARRWSAPPRPP